MFNILKNLSQNFVHSPFAHRGYHDCNGSFEGGKGPENSRCSIIHAIQNGLGVEIDVRFTKDYKPIVIHDDYLKRLCGVNKYLSNCLYSELRLLKLDNNEKLPTLEEILSIINGNTPVLIEFKKLNKTQDLINIKKELYSLLSSYSGPLALMSFDLKLISYLSKRLPNINIGLVLEKYDHYSKTFSSSVEKRVTEFQMQKNGISFVSLKYTNLTKGIYDINKKKNRKVLTWTINSELDAKKIKNLCDNITFEGFKPI